MYAWLPEDIYEINGRREGILLLIVAAFVWLNSLALSVALDGQFVWQHLWGPLIWLLVIAVAHFLLLLARPQHDPFLFPLFALLSGWGILLVDRLAPNFLTRQVTWVILGTAVVLIVSVLPTSLRPLRRYRYTLLIVGLFLLASTLLFGVNPSGFGATLWLPLPIPYTGPIYFFQPSELLKLLLVIFVASYYAEKATLLRQGRRRGLRGVLTYLAPLLLMWGFCMVLLVWQRDLGAAALFFIVFLSLLYLATGDKLYMLLGFGLLLIAGAAAYYLFDVVALRVDAWWNPWPDALGRSFQIVQSLYAVASGGVIGQGVGQGSPYFIPVVHSDFVFAAVAEEWGLIGSLGLVAIFMLLTYRGMRVAMFNRRPFRSYLAAGITFLFAVQALLIMGGVTKLLPLTGVTLPFISYGGSSFLISSVMLGLLLYISDEHELHQPFSSTQEYQYQTSDQIPIYPDRNNIQQTSTILFTAFLLVAVALFFWGVFRAPSILARNDNPRLVEREQRIQRGTIFDRRGQVLAENIGSEERQERFYPNPEIGPAVGYYSLTYGTTGAESAFDSLLRGESVSPTDAYWREALHIPQEGSDLRLALDADLQGYAQALLQDENGAVLLLEMPNDGSASAKIRVLASLPGYDPNLIDEQFEEHGENERAPLLNRVTQGQYQPGMLLQPLILASSVDQGIINLDDPIAEPQRAVAINGTAIVCASQPPEEATWKDVLHHQCPAPMQELADQLGSGGLDAIYSQFSLDRDPNLEIDTMTTADAPLADPLLAGIGQDNLSITPLQVGLAMATFSRDGIVPQPQLATAFLNEQIEWQNLSIDHEATQAVSSSTASEIREALAQDGEISEFTTAVISGPQESTNTWYVGISSGEAADDVVVVVLEGHDEKPAAQRIGRRLMSVAKKQSSPAENLPSSTSN